MHISGSALSRPGGPLSAARSASVTVPRPSLGGAPACATPARAPGPKAETVPRPAGAVRTSLSL